MMDLHTNFPNWTKERVLREAVDHAEQLAFEREYGERYTPDPIRCAVNMFRHEYSNIFLNHPYSHH